MELIFITGILGTVAVLALVILLPWEPPRRVAVILSNYRPRHGPVFPPGHGQSALSRWEYGIVGVDVCARCAAPIRDGACARCHWQPPPSRAPWPALTDQDRAALDEGLEQSRAIAAEPRPGAVILPAPTQDISGPGRAAEPGAGAWLGAYAELAPKSSPEPAESPPGAIPPRCPVCACRLFLNDRPHCNACGWQAPKYNLPWHLDDRARAALEASIEATRAIPAEQYYLLTEHRANCAIEGCPRDPGCPDCVNGFHDHPPEPELPPGGDWAPGTGPPRDDDEDDPGAVWAPDGIAYGAMHWAPTRRATGADADITRELADQDTDAATFIAQLGNVARAYVAWTASAPGTAAPDDGKAQQ
jgi:hypothetical protein